MRGRNSPLDSDPRDAGPRSDVVVVVPDFRMDVRQRRRESRLIHLLIPRVVLEVVAQAEVDRQARRDPPVVHHDREQDTYWFADLHLGIGDQPEIGVTDPQAQVEDRACFGNAGGLHGPEELGVEGQGPVEVRGAQDGLDGRRHRLLLR